MNITFVDTCVLDELLMVPMYSQQSEQIKEEFRKRVENGEKMIIPFAAMIELGNHIAGVAHDKERERCSLQFADFLKKSLNEINPWSLYTGGIDEDMVKFLGENFPETATNMKIGVGDMTIVHQYQRYCQNGGKVTGDVQIWSLDHHLTLLQEKLKKAENVIVSKTRRRNR